jgi:formylglycine-generating enzyme required for sulfatase activity
VALLAALAGGEERAAYRLTTLPMVSSPPGMVWAPGGELTMGSDTPYASRAEGPAHRVRVAGFWTDQTDVTNARFRAFVEATGYDTTAERTPTVEEIMRYAALVPARRRHPPGRAGGCRHPQGAGGEFRPAGAAARARPPRGLVPLLRRPLVRLPAQRTPGLHAGHRPVPVGFRCARTEER